MDEKVFDYLIKHIPDDYLQLIIVSYTPSLLLKKEAESIGFKKNYEEALLARCKNIERDTTLYVSESGLNLIERSKRQDKKIQFDDWEKLVELQKTNSKFKIYVLKDEDLPSVSLVLAQAKPDDYSLEPKPRWDILIEYRVGITRDKLFSIEKTIGEKDSDSEWHHHIGEKIPPAINWIKEKLEKNTKRKTFCDWFLENRHRLRFPPPDLAVLSAMPSELSTYRLQLGNKGEKELDSDKIEHVNLAVDAKTYEIVMPITSYGNEQTAQTVNDICHKFSTLQKLVFVGIAGGSTGLEVGDIVISDRILGQTYSRIGEKDMKENYGDYKSLIASLGDKKIEIRYAEYPVDDKDMIDACKKFKDEVNENGSLWKEILSKHLNKFDEISDYDKKRILDRKPKIIIGNIWSSDHNVRDVIFRMELEKIGSRAFDMEGRGLAMAAINQQKRFIEIRGISDKADKKDTAEDKVNQPIAISVASAALEMILPSILRKL